MEISVKKIFDKNLKQEFEVTLPKALIEDKINNSIKKIKKNINLKGFRKGKVPDSVIQEKYGSSIMADEADKLIAEEIKKIVKDYDLKIAMQPKVDLKNFKFGEDVDCKVTFEIFPEVPEIDLERLKVQKKDVEISKENIEEGINKLLKYFQTLEEKPSGEKARIGDCVNIDYVGKIDKKTFEGGASQNYQLELGSKSFIDDFEEQLVGRKVGDEIKVKVKFPKEYHSDEFAGKSAEFEVKINKILVAKNPEITDEFLKTNFNIENKEKLDEAMNKQLVDDYEQLSKGLFKKDLFDFLNKKYDFDLPEGLVEEQFENLWQNVEKELENNPGKFKNDKEKTKAKDEKREIAKRMIRCGIILNDIALKQKIEASSDDINKEVMKILTKFAGQEKMVIEYYQKNPEAISQLKCSILEEKVIDFIVQKPNIDRKKMSMKDFDKIWQKIND